MTGIDIPSHRDAIEIGIVILGFKASCFCFGVGGNGGRRCVCGWGGRGVYM